MPNEKNPATIERAPRNRENPYFQMARSSAQDNRLSYEAGGLLAELLSRPGDWKIKVKSLQKRGAGRDKIYRMIKELETFGYIKREQKKLANNRFGAWRYILYEIPPICADFQDTDEATPLTDFQEAEIEGEPLTDFQEAVNTQITQESQKNTLPTVVGDDKFLGCEDLPPMPKKKRKPNPNEAWYAGLCSAFSVERDALTRAEKTRYGMAANQLKEINFPTAALTFAYEYCDENYTTFTPLAIASNANAILKAWRESGDTDFESFTWDGAVEFEARYHKENLT